MGVVKDVWNLFIVLFSLTFFGAVTSVTLKLGQSALDLHQKGLFSLSKLNRSLVGPSE